MGLLNRARKGTPLTLLRHTRRLWRAQPPACWMFGQIPVAVYHFMRARVFTVWMTVFLVTILSGCAVSLWVPGAPVAALNAVTAALLLPLMVCSGKTAASQLRLRKHLSGNYPAARKARWGTPRQYRAAHDHLRKQGETRASS